MPEGRGGFMRNRKNYYELPYNPLLRERAKELRKAGNLSEVLLWQKLHKKKFKNFDFDRQKIIGDYIVDFYCLDCRVVIEIDGSSHDDKIEYDDKRNKFLEGLGLTVIHISAGDVLNRLDEVMYGLYNHPALRAPLQGGEFIDYFGIRVSFVLSFWRFLKPLLNPNIIGGNSGIIIIRYAKFKILYL